MPEPEADPILDLVRYLAPELAAVSDGDVSLAITEATDNMDEATYTAAEDDAGKDEGTWYNRAAAYYAAHLLTIRRRSAEQSGAITAKRVGDVSVSYGAPAAGADELSSTKHGQGYLTIKSNAYPRVLTVGPE